MTNLPLVVTEAAYNRTLQAWFALDECNMCGAMANCLCTDGSDGEYGGPSFCGPCLAKVQAKLKEFHVATVFKTCPFCGEEVETRAKEDFGKEWFCHRRACWNELARRNGLGEALPWEEI